jgi:hypothetical protein
MPDYLNVYCGALPCHLSRVLDSNDRPYYFRRLAIKWIFLGGIWLLFLIGCGDEDSGIDANTSDANTSDADKPTSVARPTTIYTSTSPFNQRISANPEVDSNSDLMLQSLIEDAAAQGFLIALKEWTIPVFYADANTPSRDVNLTADWAPKKTMKNVPIPNYAAPDPMDDGHMTIIHRTTGCEYDFWQISKNGDQWSASWGNVIQLNSDGIYPKGLSARGSGYGLLGGLIWPEEIQAGQINHALLFSYSYPKAGGPVPPSTESDGVSSRADAIPEGARIQLNPNLDLDTLNLTPTEKIIAKTLQDYGMILGDIGGGIQLYAVHTTSTQGDLYSGLFDQEVIEGGERFQNAYVMLNKIPVDQLHILKLGVQVADSEEELISNSCAEFE